MDAESTQYGVASPMGEGTSELNLKGVIGFNGTSRRLYFDINSDNLINVSGYSGIKIYQSNTLYIYSINCVGAVPNGLILHPGDQHIIYPLGSTIVVKHLTKNTQAFLQRGGHNSTVSCIALSRTGKYLASGQVTHMGFNVRTSVH